MSIYVHWAILNHARRKGSVFSSGFLSNINILMLVVTKTSDEIYWSEKNNVIQYIIERKLEKKSFPSLRAHDAARYTYKLFLSYRLFLLSARMSNVNVTGNRSQLYFDFRFTSTITTTWNIWKRAAHSKGDLKFHMIANYARYSCMQWTIKGVYCGAKKNIKYAELFPKWHPFFTFPSLTTKTQIFCTSHRRDKNYVNLRIKFS